MEGLFSLKNNIKAMQNDIQNVNYTNKIQGVNLDDFIFNRILTRIDPIAYCENVLRAHLPMNRRYLHENQVELIRAVTNPRKIAA